MRRVCVPVDASLSRMEESRLSGDCVFSGGFLKLFRDVVSLPDGQPSVREYVTHPDGVLIVPLLDPQTLVMVRQFRYPAQRLMLEFPAGKIESGETALSAARRELLEETGYRCESLETLIHLPMPVAYVKAGMTIVLAKGLAYVGHPGEPGEFVQPEKISVDHLGGCVANGEVGDMKDLIALMLLDKLGIFPVPNLFSGLPREAP